MSLAVGDMYWSLSARRRAHQGWTLGFKSLGGTTMDALVLIREMRKGRDVDFYSMYVTEYKFPSLPKCASLKTLQAKTLDFVFWGQKTCIGKRVQH